MPKQCKHPCCGETCRKTKAPKWRAKPKPIADKRAKELTLYRKQRIAYLNEHPLCELQVEGICNGVAVEIHHTEGRENERLNDVPRFKATCRPCHEFATVNSRKAIELGISISKHKKAS